MDQHIDPVSLLKTEHEKAEERNTSLQCRIIELENQLQSNVQSSRLKTPTMNGPSSSTKRKRDGPMELRQNARASKKQRSGSDFRNGVVMIDVFGIPKLDSTLFLPFGPGEPLNQLTCLQMINFDSWTVIPSEPVSFS